MASFLCYNGFCYFSKKLNSEAVVLITGLTAMSRGSKFQLLLVSDIINMVM